MEQWIWGRGGVETLGEVEGEEAAVVMYCKREEYIKRKKNKMFQLLHAPFCSFPNKW